MERISVRTLSKSEIRDITAQVQAAVRSSRVSSGVCHVFVPHTTAAVMLNEHADPDVAADIASQLQAIVPDNARYRHSEGNSPGHIKTSLVGNSLTVFVEGGELVLGTWQGVFFAEFDGPRNRTVLVKVVADGD